MTVGAADSVEITFPELIDLSEETIWKMVEPFIDNELHYCACPNIEIALIVIMETERQVLRREYVKSYNLVVNND